MSVEDDELHSEHFVKSQGRCVNHNTPYKLIRCRGKVCAEQIVAIFGVFMTVDATLDSAARRIRRIQDVVKKVFPVAML